MNECHLFNRSNKASLRLPRMQEPVQTLRTPSCDRGSRLKSFVPVWRDELDETITKRQETQLILMKALYL